MTNELEEYFFNMFEIEPYLEIGMIAYPEITDTHYLKLICLLNVTLIKIVKLRGDSLEQLKKFILQGCITDYEFYSNSSLPEHNEQAENFKHQVRTLFEEG